MLHVVRPIRTGHDVKLGGPAKHAVFPHTYGTIISETADTPLHIPALCRQWLCNSPFSSHRSLPSRIRLLTWTPSAAVVAKKLRRRRTTDYYMAYACMRSLWRELCPTMCLLIRWVACPEPAVEARGFLSSTH